jgi:hypothetical protein
LLLGRLPCLFPSLFIHADALAYKI